jgi:hypothetical protein
MSKNKEVYIHQYKGNYAVLDEDGEVLYESFDKGAVEDYCMKHKLHVANDSIFKRFARRIIKCFSARNTFKYDKDQQKFLDNLNAKDDYVCILDDESKDFASYIFEPVDPVKTKGSTAFITFSKDFISYNIVDHDGNAKSVVVIKKNKYKDAWDQFIKDLG